MNVFLEIGEKYFKFATNFIFIVALAIIGGQIFEAGLRTEEVIEFNYIYKPANLIFGILATLISLYLYGTAPNIYVKISRAIFSLISIFYLLFSIIWILNLFDKNVDVAGFSHFLAICIGFLSISFKISTLGNSDIHPATLFVLSFIF
ncbi:MAG: hypothetical protein IPO92_06150 [Saprospiraceae bacterium]|nr:hypothetical protein [Saprospiraceae bacterium]